MRINSIKTMIILMLVVLTLTQDNTTVQKQPINLIDMYNIILEKGQTKIYTLTIKGLKANDSLFVKAASPTYDPSEIPTVVLRSENNQQKLCKEETNKFEGICEVPHQNLKEGKLFDIEIKCDVKCTLELQTLLSETLQVEFGQKITIFPQKPIDTLQYLAIKVPDNLTFTDINLITNFLGGDNIDEGAEIYINIGNETVAVPTIEDFMFKGRDVWGDGIGVFLSKAQIKPGQWIKILLIFGKGVRIEFYSQLINDDTYQILLNTAYKDFTNENEKKLYVLELQQESDNSSTKRTNTTNNNMSQKTIEIKFVIYSGTPSIKVGFDPQFKTQLDNYNFQGTFSYLITPQIRERNNYTGNIYIQVQSFWSSSYDLQGFTLSDNYYKLSEGIAQLSRAESKEVQNYIYQSFIMVNEGDLSMRESYKLRVEIISGLADVRVRRCPSLQNNNSLDWLITNISQLQEKTIKDSFEEINITLRKDWDSYELLFDYEASNCQLNKQYANLKIYKCQFQVVVFPAKLFDKEFVYSVTMFQNCEEGTLKEAYPYKDFLRAGTYHYFDFQLPDELVKVEEVTFFMTVISGDAAIMGTTNDKFKYMEFSDSVSQDDIMLSLFNTITFKKNQLSNNKYYIAIYAYQESDITVNVIVKRIDQSKSDKNKTSDNSTANNTTPSIKAQVTILYMIEGLSQQYTLNNGYESIDFAFTATQQGNVTIDLIEITGTVTFTLSKEDSYQVINCSNYIQSGERKCTFSAEQYAKYIVHIKAQMSEIQTFSISYYTASVCKKYSFNLPQFVFLAAKQKQCSSYSITDKTKSIQVITSFSTIDLLTTNIKFTATFNNEHEIEWTDKQKQITADQLKDFCKSGNMSNCIMRLGYFGDDLVSQKFYFVVEKAGMEMTLFDGIVRKVVDQKMTQTKGKFFYYEVTSNKDSVKIFTSNRNEVGYYVGAKFVDIAQFTASSDSLYLPYRQNISVPLQNTFQTYLSPLKGTSVIQIEPQKFTKYCKQCVVLISVFGQQAQSLGANIFQIEVTQIQSFLYLGEQQTSFLSEDEIYVYDIYGNPNAQSLLTIRDFLRESDKENNCFIASISEVGKQSSTSIAYGEHVVPKSASTYKVFIQNVGQDICAYQISFSALDKPISELKTYIPIELKLQNYQINYFIHHHRQQTSFQILSYIQSGDIQISANKVDEDVTIETLMGRNIDEYDFVSLAGDSFLEVTSSNQVKFCQNCYYMIAVKGDPSVQAQLAIIKGDEPIGLTTYGLLKQTLKKGQTQSYVYYTIFDFNISVPLLFGQIRITITTPTNQTFYNETIRQFTQIFVPRPNSTQNQFIDHYTDESKFEVRIEALMDSSYYVSVKRKDVSLRVYEGIPITLALGTEKKTVEFVNMNDEESNVSLMLEVRDNHITDGNLTIDIIADVMKEGSVNSVQLPEPILKKSQNSFNYVFNSVKGTYFITMKSSSKAILSFILVKKKLTHLVSSNVNLFTENGIFEIYSLGNNLMIVVDTCLKEVQVKASQNYQALSGNGNSAAPVLLEHPNFGGHYVITAQNVRGQFFVQVNHKTPQDSMLYIISYFYYDKSDDMPYKKVDVDPEISYQLSKDKIVFLLSPVRMLPFKHKFNIVPTYTLYISSNTNTTSMNSRCNLNVGFSVSQTVIDSQLNDGVVRFPIQLNTIANEIGENTDVYYVSAKVKVIFEGDTVITGYTPYIDLAYMKLQLTQSTHTVEFISETTSQIKYVLLYLVVPVIITLLLFGLALKFCINKYRQLYPSQLVEDDREMVASVDQIKSASNLMPADCLTNI